MTPQAATANGIRFTGLAHVLPSRQVTNEEVLDRVRERSAPFLSERELDELTTATSAALRSAGTQVRYHRAEGERAYELCLRAGADALASSGLQPGDIDLLIYVGVGRGFLEPATANVFQDLLGLENATCFDILDACASWIRAVDIARSMLRGGRYRNAMILNAEFMGRDAHRYELKAVSEFAHWFPGVTIGEAATATVLTASDVDDSFEASFRNWGSKRGLCLLPLPNLAEYLGQPAYQDHEPRPLEFTSFGGPLLLFGAAKLAGHYNQSPAFNQARYDCIFGHAASNAMCENVAALCSIDLARFHFTHHLYGNTVSASVPLAMSLARASGSLRDGASVLILVASAGVSTALARFTFRS
jgi:3-oxoacyl-[acyl-carrier-protein] synthase III